MESSAVARLQLVTAALLFSTGGAAIKATGLSGWQVSSFRSGIAAVVLLLLLPSARRRWTWRTLLVGIAYAGTLTLFVLGNKLTTAANTIFLQSTAPLYILVLGPLLLREPVRRRDLAFMGAVALGLLLLVGGGEAATATAPDPARGNLYGAGAGLCWAFTVVGLRWMGREEERTGGAAASVAVGNLIACAVCLGPALPATGGGPVDWAVVVYLGVVQVALAYVALIRGIRGVPALEASLLLLLEPVLNPVWAWGLHGEVPGTGALVGGGIIVVATAVNTVTARRGSSRGSG